MAIKKLVKLDHKDPLLNQQIRHHEDVFNSINLALQPTSLLAATTSSLDSRYTSTATTDSRYPSTASFAALSASLSTFSSSVNAFTGSADNRYVLTASFKPFSASINAFTASINAFTASADTRYTLTSSFSAYSSSINTFSASVNVFSASANTFSASVKSFTSSADSRYILTASFRSTGSVNQVAYWNSSTLLTGSNAFVIISGNVGIGPTNPLTDLHVLGDVWVDTGILAVSASAPYIAIKSTLAAASFPSAYLQLSSALADYRIYNNSSAEFAVYDNAAGAYRFKIDSTGKVGINQTPSVDQLCINGIVRSLGYRCLQGTAGASYGNVFNSYWTGAALQAWVDTSNVGTFTLTSDRRLKHSIKTLTGSSLDTISKLRPVSYRFKNQDVWRDDGKDRIGFIADELQQHIPSAVHDQSGSYQSIDPLQLFPHLVKAVQELQQQVAALQDRLFTLENKNK